MQERTAVVIGATGLIGSYLVNLLLNDTSFHTVRALVRRPLLFSHPKLDVRLTDFADNNDYQKKLGKRNMLFCCIGTTQKKVKGDKEAYRKVDFDIAVNAARLAKQGGFKKFLLVSSVGANAASSNFYLHLKGEVEQAVAAIEFDSCLIFQPSILLGKRNRVMQRVFKIVSYFFIGPLHEYGHWGSRCG